MTESTTSSTSQLTPAEAVTFYPTQTDGSLGSLTIGGGGTDAKNGERVGEINGKEIPTDATYAELFEHLRHRCAEPVTAVAHDSRRGVNDTNIHRRFSKTTPYDAAQR